jgi:hypothetical protein
MVIRHQVQADPGVHVPGIDDPIEDLRAQACEEDAEGQPLWSGAQSPSGKPRRSSNRPRPQPPRPSKDKPFSPRPSRQEVERRVAEAQLWVAQRLPLVEIRANARQNWGITNVRTVSRYLSLARQRMVEELIQNRLQHQAEQIFALNECARRAMDAGQFNAAVGAFRVIAEIGGLLRAPLKAPGGWG